MCSISGFTWDNPDLIKKMNELLSYRGPDDTGVFIDDLISLGHNRLSIIDLSKAGHQPMPDKDEDLWIVYNGEVYNFMEIREDLETKGYTFNSNTDTEVILYAYKEYGAECLNLFNGMFAFAIWDTKNKELFLARDRIGIKPLYYCYKDKNLIFSSEIKALLLHEIERELDLQCLNSYLTYRFIPSSKTMLKGIRKLMPGHYAIFKNGQLTIKKYWDLSWKIDTRSENYFISQLDKLLNESVEYRLMSDVPLGAYLSGGIDSSLVVAINSRLRDDPVKTFTVGFGHKSDEFNYAQKVAEFYSTDHHDITLDYKTINQTLPTIIWQMDEPHSEMTIVPLYFLSEFAKKSVTVVNTGEGADELLSGYPYYYLGAKIFKPIPDFIKRFIYLWYYSPFKNKDRKELLNYSFEQDNKLEHYLKCRIYPKEPKDFLNKTLLFEIKHELTNWELNRTDKMTMAHSLEARVPFLDHRIVELTASMPIALKQPTLMGKYILKKLALKYLPHEIVFRKKQGFYVPMHTWIKDTLEDALETLLFSNKKPFFNYNYIKRLIHKHKNTTSRRPFQLYSFQLLTLLFFDIWYDLYIENIPKKEIEKKLVI